MFDYDYMSRRVRKQVYAWDTGTSDWNATASVDERYVYDGWNVIMVLDGLNSNAVTRKHTWGLDLSGQTGNGSVSGMGVAPGVSPVSGMGVAPGVSPVSGLHAAGGTLDTRGSRQGQVGGLLSVYDTQSTSQTTDDKTYWLCYDGHGNVVQLLDASDGTPDPASDLAAHYEYDAYGNLITRTGTYADTHPIRFSTKWFDPETGLGYWGYRYYSPDYGRWLNNDPIAQWGGANLLAYNYNSAVNYIDAVGLTPVVISDPPTSGGMPFPIGPVGPYLPGPISSIGSGASPGCSPFIPPFMPPQAIPFPPTIGDGYGSEPIIIMFPTLPYLDVPDSFREFCNSLANRIANIIREIEEREHKIHTNPCSLPQRECPGMKPHESVDGHRKIVGDLKRALRKAEDEYRNKCKPNRYRPIDPAPSPTPVSRPQCPQTLPPLPDVPPIVILPKPPSVGRPSYQPVRVPCRSIGIRGGGGGGGCFAAGTPVHTCNGTVAIETLRVGDTVISLNTETMMLEDKVITALRTTCRSDTVIVRFATFSVLCSCNHRFHASNASVEAQNLEPGQSITRISADGTLQREIVREVIHPHMEDPTILYNISVSDYHCFFVGISGVLVHNFKDIPGLGWDF